MDTVSLVFRKEDMTATPKLYIEGQHAAARFASCYRHACHWVDVVSKQDEVIYRWEEGKLLWGKEDLSAMDLKIEPFKFSDKIDDEEERKNWCMQSAEMLDYAFSVAVGWEEAFRRPCSLDVVLKPNMRLWELILEAEEVAQGSVACRTVEDRLDYILNWIASPLSFFQRTRVHYYALASENGVGAREIFDLDQRLDEAEIDWFSKTRRAM